MLGSNCLRLPAAQFLGFAKIALLSFVCSSFSILKSRWLIKTSPLISNKFGNVFDLIDNGIALIVYKLWVISSPINPSPLVDPYWKIPFSYTSSTANPSSFGSAIYSTLSIPKPLLICYWNFQAHKYPLH